MTDPLDKPQPLAVSIIIPTWNEAGQIADLAGSLAGQPGVELIFVDGGSNDGTWQKIAEMKHRLPGIHLLHAPRSRSRQMNAGARLARGEWLLFLHADTKLPLASLQAFLQTAAQDTRLVAGAFRFRVTHPRRVYRYLEWYVALRCRLLKLPYGDQALFVKRQVFAKSGGFREDFPLMEDLEFVRRLNRAPGFRVLSAPVYTSARRYEAEGFCKRGWNNLRLQFLYACGVPPVRLAADYWKSAGGSQPIFAEQSMPTVQPVEQGSTNANIHGTGQQWPGAAECKARTWSRLSPHLRTPEQWLGRRKAIGCVSLEITQRCNLDCELCYLSEMSEATLDPPLVALEQRLREIRAHYGPGTAVQISGGDPTLRAEDELLAIVRCAAALDLQPALLTNGIKATRPLLEKLAAAGLTDVAFHVDLTMKLRKADKSLYTSEEELNERRLEYIARARGLKLAVIFNTTLCARNFHELPMLVRFFCTHADVVGMCSFQLQADTGRGTLRGRPGEITPDNVVRIINEQVKHRINFDVFTIGHPQCNRVGYSFVSNGNAYDLWHDPGIINRLADKFEGVKIDRRDPAAAVKNLARHIIKHPVLLWEAAKFVGVHAWRMKGDLLRSGLRVHKLSFFVHNFMHAQALDPERIANCSFMVMTVNGPMSMCLHNANRDAYITAPFVIRQNGQEQVFNPVRPHRRASWESKKAMLAGPAASAVRADSASG
ncbi:MAG: TIGR04283 family arsenosugar biosynthesis glycosyltransferase [candidate division KSB1 bacterium]|nr:TIGR04283 family arsenosugar biosynthesis glycosyltransferase [candidate division KSB1 bacterium]MDZ7272652.1 TIGR04283 family arsenosugar biosynthesis glycosyltransferase [candidate division KSB1 bacterium]MDZ7284326.1 TIGR04283 family arsenosugar biosynthesis glycosyltransferase [candidate division KSB1 bacterium]MDZ7297278.1 TIGR04283 family arsenosugar biosynthesis glycosyltransferase [candidate division KSB1 bacterium]MDZ7309397.1 TIGR04283 family arsenosugar biosynthesis glycosyltransf